jgi:hydrogenase maturation factor
MSNSASNAQISACQRDADHHCLTCSDELVPVKVVRVDQEVGLALVEVSEQLEEVDITLIEDVVVGDVLLAHGGVAVARLEAENTSQSHNDMHKEQKL